MNKLASKNSLKMAAAAGGTIFISTKMLKTKNHSLAAAEQKEADK